MRPNLRAFAFLLGALLISQSVAAQITSSISGVVTDSTGAVVNGATIVVESPALVRGRASTTSDAAGRYVLTGLQPGVYSVRGEATGFAPEVRNGVNVPLNTDVHVDFKMAVAGVHEEVSVEGGSISQVRTEDSDLKAGIDTKTIDDIPLNGRQFLDLMTLVPGVAPRPSSSDQGANITVFGERSITNSFLIDGLDNNDQFTRNFSEYFVQDAIQEFQVLLGGYQAEFGRASGAVANVITRGGTNKFHGRAFYFLRDSAMDSSNIPNQDPPELRRHDVGGTLGGPLWKGRTFFFDAFEYFQERRGLSFDQSVLPPIVQSGYFSPAVGGKEPFDVPPLQHRYTNFFRLDHRLNEQNQLYFSVNINRGDNDNFLPPPDQAFFSPPPGTLTLPSTASDIASNSTSAALRHTAFFSSRTFLESSLRFSRPIFQENTDKPRGAEQIFPITFVPSFHIFESNSNAVGVTDLKQNRFEWGENLSHSFGTARLGQHNLKFGVGVLHTSLYDRFIAPGAIILGNTILDNNFAKLGHMVDMQKFIAPATGNDLAHATDNLLGFYAQDAWRVARGFTLNLGARYDYSTLFSEANKNVSPRVGFAWDIANKGKTVVRASYGLFYDQEILESVLFTPELGGIQLGSFDFQLIPRGASFYNNPGIGAFGPLQDSGNLWLANPKFYSFILPAGTVRTNGVTTIVGLGQPYIIYQLLGIPVPDPANPPVLTAESIPTLTGGALTPAQALGIINSFFPGPNGPQFDFLPNQGPNSIITGSSLIFKNRLLSPSVDAIQTVEHPFKTPYTGSFNVGIQQALGKDMSIDLEYFVRRGRHLLARRVVNLREVPVGAGCAQNTLDGGPCNRQLGYIGFLNANLLTISFNKRFSHSFQFMTSYTHTDATDNFSTLRVPPRGGETSFLLNNHPSLDIGRSLNTPNHTFAFSGLYQMPLGFELSGVIKAASGSPFNAAGLPLDSDGDGIFDNRLLGTQKGQFQTAPFFEADMRVAKHFKFGERFRATALLEMFNVTNRANPFIVNRTCGNSGGGGLPDPGGCTGPDFGKIVQPYPGREVQLGFRFEF